MTDSAVQGDGVQPIRAGFELLEERITAIAKGVVDQSAMDSQSAVQAAGERGA